MRLAIMQPYLFPYIGYFQLMKAADKFIILEDVSFINKGWINRNNMLINGKSNLFSIPLLDASQNKNINTIELSNDKKWRIKFIKTLEMAYKKAPLYTTIFPIIETIIFSESIYISELIKNSFININKYLKIDTEIITSASHYNNEDLKGQDRILDICVKEKATKYYNLIGGKDLYSKELFEKKGIELKFIKSKEIQYRQFNSEFIPWLSIIDILMFNDLEVVNSFLENYELI